MREQDSHQSHGNLPRCRSSSRPVTFPAFFNMINDKSGTWTVASYASYRNDQGVPNLSSRRQDPQLVALGMAIRRIRRANKISQEKLALTAELDRSYVGRVERGDNNVAMLTLSRIALALGVSMSQLLIEAGL
jgi:ribosome-binding protein aMBF1 (putative translation factor)